MSFLGGFWVWVFVFLALISETLKSVPEVFFEKTLCASPCRGNAAQSAPVVRKSTTGEAQSTQHFYNVMQFTHHMTTSKISVKNHTNLRSDISGPVLRNVTNEDARK